MNSNFEKIKIHFGAHKTATTHLQNSLENRRDELSSKGIDCIVPHSLKSVGFRPKPGIFNWKLMFYGKPMIKYLINSLNSASQGQKWVVISDEKIVGGSWELLFSPIYPRMEKRLHALSTLCQVYDVQFYLSIRSFDEILPSAYAQAIRYSPIEGGFESVRGKYAQNLPSWIDLINRIGGIIPLDRLRIWRMEDYRYNEWKILSALCDVDIPEGDSVPIPKSTKAPSWEAIREIESLSYENTRKLYKSLVHDIVERDQGSCRFRPFTMEEERILKEKFEEDVFRIENELPCHLIRC